MLSPPAGVAAPRVALEDALDFLVKAQGGPQSTDEVKRHFRDLCERHPGVGMELLWEPERYAGTLNCDMLLRLPTGGTVSLGFAADHAVPWLLRSASHSHECDVAVVNNRLIDIQMVVAYLDLLWNDTRLLEQMVEDQLIDEAVDRLGIEPSPADVQAAMDGFRSAHGLYGADETMRWMAERGMSHDRLEWIVSRDAAAAALRRRVVSDDQVRVRLEQDASPFDTVHLARFRVSDEAEARELVTAVRHNGLDFFRIAQQRFVAGESAHAGQRGADLFAVQTRGSLSADQAALLFGAEPGDTIGPVKSGGGIDVVRILAVTRAHSDDPASRSAARRAMFAEWLAAQRATARVEWFWGNAGKTSTRTSAG